MKSSVEKRMQERIDVKLVLRFIATSFVYFLAGLVIFAVNLIFSLNMHRDPIFVMWLFGGVVMIIFGLSYMFSSGIAKNSAMANNTVHIEYILLNIGVVLFFLGFSLFLGFSGVGSYGIGKPLAITGLMAIIVSMLIHLINIFVMISRDPYKNKKHGSP
ncbi:MULTISPECIES: hypothetical protein [Ferroplasma]|jgi:hypothetical protein|uniref:Uncharacterized protein n=2 Tax=Ferroplasma TaxID=74968 RepID=S0APL9_FERAC|nr:MULTISPECIES: hypothetical protein [Ferroplasma]MCL4348988.1 hypothetical protein [Candidatus Thermoplasmatota archaeon]AGO60831.1 hypothetical protein FACI_IFERC00001G0851 [Ferroplasma acidarmanus Fer1]ARD85580.1 hypothetical protein FAD_1741 [Ferroplasma acidiphilum]NOL59975.1 hypothetical protein [Ferroplasma acidiphilum]WMT52715.1 MAG: hypothetical protein RE473_06810 [Ferroplasma acidiphilum]